jgi:hypothetical protein
MINSANPPIALGETMKGTDAAGNLINQQWEGAIFEMKDTRSGSKGEQIVVAVVRNVYQVASAGAALLGQRLGILKSDGGRKFSGQVIGYADKNFHNHAVAIDDQLPAAGVAYNDLFLVILRGHFTGLTDNAGTGYSDIAAGDALFAGTAAGSTTSLAGRLVGLTIVTAHATNAVTAAIGGRGVALTARATTETSTNILAYINRSPLL